MTNKQKLMPIVALFVILIANPTSFGVAVEAASFKTTKTSYIDLVDPLNDSITPIITTGDTLDNGFVFDQIPDGIGLISSKSSDDHDEDDESDSKKSKRGKVVAYINHELNNNAKVSKITLDKDGNVIDAKYVIGENGIGMGSSGYSRFCSSSIADDGAFKKNSYYLTNEEVDNGKVVLINTKTDAVTALDDLGLMAHEQTINIPMFWNSVKKVVLLTAEDGEAGQSELYLYTANSIDDLLAGNGQLYVWSANDPSKTNWTHFPSIGAGSLLGKFIPIPDTWKTPTTEPTPEEQLDADAISLGGMQFIRLEDAAVDKRNKFENVIYIADTGNEAPKLDDGTIPGDFRHGRMYKLTFTDKNDPTKASIQVILDGDVPGNPGSVLDAHGRSMLSNPDNIDTSEHSLMIQEDRSGPTRFNTTPASAIDASNNAKILRYDLQSGQLEAVGYLNQFYINGVRHGDWESSGIHDASKWFGKGSWIIDVQGHSLEGAKIDGQVSLLRILDS